MDYLRKGFLQTIKCRLNLAESLLTTHFAQRSTATTLADGGILITNLKQAERPKNSKKAKKSTTSENSQPASDVCHLRSNSIKPAP
eukprot:8610623-Ditylum_brightwellii.AAC.1